MKVNGETLISDLIGRTKEVVNAVTLYQQLTNKQLNWKEHPESWSILECIEHLNRYGDYYLPKIELLLNSNASPAQEFFVSGWLGNYFANSMLPKAKLNKMKTFKEMNPLNSQLERNVLDEFIKQQNKMVQLLNLARAKSLNKLRVGISIAPFVKLKLGDTFRFNIYHNQRHIVQAQKVLAAMRDSGAQ